MGRYEDMNVYEPSSYFAEEVRKRWSLTVLTLLPISHGNMRISTFNEICCVWGSKLSMAISRNCVYGFAMDKPRNFQRKCSGKSITNHLWSIMGMYWAITWYSSPLRYCYWGRSNGDMMGVLFGISMDIRGQFTYYVRFSLGIFTGNVFHQPSRCYIRYQYLWKRPGADLCLLSPDLWSHTCSIEAT